MDIKYLETGFNAEAVTKYEQDVWVEWAMPRFFSHIKDEDERRKQLEHVHTMCVAALTPAIPHVEIEEPVVGEPVSSNTRRQRRTRGKNKEEEPATETEDEP